MVLPGIKANTSPTDFYPLQSVKMHRFEGESFKPFGEVISAEAPTQ
jgi:branched-chain amino acid transport system substrate-binding protein